MNSIHRKWFFLCCLVLLMPVMAAFAQDWSLPSQQPLTDVLCSTCVGKSDMKTIGYPPTLRFVGRFADSERTREIESPFRTIRARGVWALESPDPAKSRIYMILGSAVAAYNMDNFFSREAAQETMFSAQAVPIVFPGGNNHGSPYELFLWWDRFFYAENGGGWEVPGVDGQDRLFGLDWDDRGLVYLAYSVFGWGIVRDDFGTAGTGATAMPSLHQQVPGANDVSPLNIVACKTSDGAYNVVVAGGDTKAQSWNVSDPQNPVKRGDLAGRAFFSSVKDVAGSRVATVDSNGHLNIYTNDAFVAGGAPLSSLFLTSGQYKSVTWDGTNFFALAIVGGVPNVVVINGSTFAQTFVPLSFTFATPGGIRAGGGFLAVWGIEYTAPGANLRLYKIGNGGSLTDVPLTVGTPPVPYFAAYYGGASPAGYTHPLFFVPSDVLPFKRGSKTYLILEGFGLGDVYEIKAGDALTAHLTSNPTPFYGDTLSFTSSTTSNNQVGVTWDFGDTAVGFTPPGSPAITHQYGGATASDLPLIRHITAANAADSSMSDAITVTLAKPQPTFKLSATGYLFKIPDASSPAQIVTGDTFADISDGASEGHYAEWALDSPTGSTKPAFSTFAVGSCGVHTLKFTAHYGPYNAATFTGSSDAKFPIDSVTYASRPFSAAIQVPDAGSLLTNPTNAVFTASVRASSLPADLSGGLATACNYEWDVVDSLNVNRQRLQGSATLGTIPQFPVPRTLFNGSGMKVLLTASVSTDATSSACRTAGFSSHSVDSGILNGPDPTVVVTGCTNANGACKLSVTSGGSQTGWSYAWTVSGPDTFSASSPDFSPVISKVGTYTVTLVVTNGIGSSTVHSSPLSISQPLCPEPPIGNTAIGYNGATSNCLTALDKCASGETITFRASPFQWTPSDCNKYAWDFGDGATSTLPTPTHSYSGNGTYTVKLDITGVTITDHESTTLTIGAQGNGGDGGNGGNGGNGGGTCSAMTPQSGYVGFVGTTCNLGFGNCTPGDSILFTLYSQGYNFDCPFTTYQWSFSDGTGGTGRTFAHAFATAGSYNASVTVTNGGGSQVFSASVPVGTVVGKVCGTMTQSNIALTYGGPNCSDAGGDCKPSDTILFSAVNRGSPAYDFSCATHNYSWAFGDGGTSSLASPTHAYTNAGQYTAQVTITQGSQSVTVSHVVSVNGTTTGGTGNCPIMYPDGNVYVTYGGAVSQCPFGASGACNPGEVVNFHAASLGYDFNCGSHTFTWDFGDGGQSTAQNPSHTYLTDGTYKVTLHITNPRPQATDVSVSVKVGSGVSVPPRHRPSRH